MAGAAKSTKPTQSERDANIDSKIKEAQTERQAGNERYKAGDMKGALGHYYNVLLFLKGLDATIANALTAAPSAPSGKSAKSGKVDRNATLKQVIGMTYSNMSACHIQLQNWPKALQFALEAKKSNPDDPKAKFREAKARIQLGQIKPGRELLEELLTKGEDNTVRSALTQLDADEKVRDVKSKAQFKGMFSRPEATTETTAPGSDSAKDPKS